MAGICLENNFSYIYKQKTTEVAQEKQLVV